MQDSTDNKLTYKRILDRAMSDAREAMPNLPTANTLEAWEAFIADLEALDAYDIASESSEWDWVIYYSRAMELCLCVPSSVLNDSEESYAEFCLEVEGFYQYATQLASLIVTSEIAQAVETLKDELLELANTQIDNGEW